MGRISLGGEKYVVMNRPPAFMFYVKDWLTSKKRATMTLEQQAAYLNLLSHCWDSDDCSLPDDDAELAALSELRDKWSTAGARVKLCFIPHPKHPGHLTNERLLKEFTTLQKVRRAKQRAGHVGGIKSGLSRRQIRAIHTEAEPKQTFDCALSKTEANRTSSSSSSSSSSISIKKKTKTAHRADVLNGCRVNFDIFYEHFPKKRSKGQAEKAWAKLQPDDVLLGTMLSKIDQAKRTPQWTKNGGEFIPNPASWLNAKGWEDEFAEPPKERIPL